MANSILTINILACACVVHKRCHDKVNTYCAGTRDNIDQEKTAIDQQPSLNNPHRLVLRNYKWFTFCNHCGSLLHGITKQGLRCQGCNVNVHKKCQINFAQSCSTNSN